MNKAVLISIQPKFCELIADGEKTIEVRKSKPKLETPFKVYIYCTKQGKWFFHDGLGEKQSLFQNPDTGEIKFDFAFELMCCENKYTEDNFLSGKVIGEFVCDKIEPIDVPYPAWQKDLPKKILDNACLAYAYLHYYIGSGNRCYAWHISDLVIYDKPKELSEFINYNKHKICLEQNCFSADCYFCPNNAIVIRPPQSWCYVKSQ